MDFAISIAIDNTNCHIRSFRNHTIPHEVVQDRPHKHYFMEFHGIFDGSEIVTLPLENREIRLLPGQILMLPSGVYHGVTTRGGEVERLCFNFKAECEGKERSRILELFQNLREAVVFDDHTAAVMLDRCRQLRHQQSGSITDIQQGVILLGVILELFSSLPDPQMLTGLENPRAQRQKWIIEDYIERHFTDNSGIDGLAQSLFLSERQTRFLVKQFMGEDFKQIIIRRRMELAEIFLRDETKSLEDIAQQVGYRSYSGFNLAFKRQFGVTPRERRKELLR